jgi:hypothetical protein
LEHMKRALSKDMECIEYHQHIQYVYLCDFLSVRGGNTIEDVLIHMDLFIAKHYTIEWSGWSHMQG